MKRTLTASLFRDVLIAASVAVTIFVGGQAAKAGIFGVKCTLFIAGCDIDVANCCVAVGTQWSTSTPTGQTPSAAPITAPANCAAQITKKWYGCSSPQTGTCGGATTTAGCD